jgi:aryl-alcohol dehydrogenase-like predicted oxidoreductase
MYNLLKRQVEVEILPLAKSENLAVMPYNPLAAGMLTGKYLNNDFSSGKRISDNEMYRKRYQKEGYNEVCERFLDFCKENGYNQPHYQLLG